MPPAPSEISRDELLAFLRREGFRVSPHQLLRWHDWGLLPQPRREGLGRGKGTASYYPKGAALQARALVRLLEEDRSLVEAGWGLWVLGFPVTEWARDLLVAELTDRERMLAKEVRSLKRGGKLANQIRRRAPRELARMQKVAGPGAMPRLLQMLTDQQLGTLRAEDYAEDDWDLLQGAALNQLWPDLATAPELPSPQDVAKDMARLSSQASLKQVITALNSLPAPRLEQYRNEAQWFSERFANPEVPASARLSRDEFIAFLKIRHLDPEGARGMPHLMRALGQSHPPASPIQRWLQAQRSVAASPTTSPR